MKRIICLAVLVFAAGLSVTTAGYQTPQPAGVKVPDIQRVKDRLYVIGGADPRDAATFTGGNTAVFLTDTGVVVVDTKWPGWGRVILDRIKSVTDKPVTMIINTHTHGDHSGSNTEFPATIEFIAHENTKANMSKVSCAPVGNCQSFKGENAKFLPKRTFKEKLSLLSGNDRIDLYHFGRGHTNGDALVVFPAARTMHTGDLYQLKWLPFIDPASGGSGVAFPDTLARAVATIKDVDTIIPGHSPIATWNDFKEHAELLKEFRTTVEAGIKAGKSTDEIAKAYKVPGKYKGYTTDAERVRTNVQMIVDELKK
jgi:glyoxylase-like metal-dependent hydrolase (beta-lactamase superfamily II)